MGYGRGGYHRNLGGGGTEENLVEKVLTDQRAGHYSKIFPGSQLL